MEDIKIYSTEKYYISMIEKLKKENEELRNELRRQKDERNN